MNPSLLPFRSSVKKLVELPATGLLYKVDFDRKKVDQIRKDLQEYKAKLVAVSKTKSVTSIQALYDYGQKAFGENYVQELVDKKSQLPEDVEWHFIGHLQSNKVKLISPFVSLIHGVDSIKLLQEIDKQSAKSGKVQSCLLQIFIASEETKFGLSMDEADELLNHPVLSSLNHVSISGFMGMATFTEDTTKIRSEFRSLKMFFDAQKKKSFCQNVQLQELSMGMTSDYLIALEEGSTMVRIGSAIFGERN